MILVPAEETVVVAQTACKTARNRFLLYDLHGGEVHLGDAITPKIPIAVVREACVDIPPPT